MSQKESRRESREQAFLFLFECSFAETAATGEVMENALEARGYKASPFAASLFVGAWDHKDEIDQQIEENSHKWKADRLSRVTLSILRLAIYELLYCEDIPTSVSINEAVELAKQYGGAEDSSYVNGVLGGVVRALPEKSADKL
ncbi:MAG: transcription antitermination factor NusB [Clostridia bacterium]|nr:transcription antitermination factor NusB [Clostridia bacterium]